MRTCAPAEVAIQARLQSIDVRGLISMSTAFELCINRHDHARGAKAALRSVIDGDLFCNGTAM